MAETKKAALEAYDEFFTLYEAKYPKAWRLPEERQGNSTNVLRLSSRALETHPDDKPD